MPETARFLARVGGDGAEAQKVIEGITGNRTETAPLLDRRAWHEVFRLHARGVFGAALLWMFYDVVVYSSILFGPSVIAQGIGTTAVGFILITYGLFSMPGTILGCLLIDRVGRRWLTAVGFGTAGLALLAYAPMQDAAGKSPVAAFVMFGMFSFLLSLGPGAISGSGLLGVELAPTRIRSIAQGVTVVGGRLGASIAAFVFPALLGYISGSSLMVLLAVTSIVGAAITFLVVPETKGRSLEDINADTDAAIAAAVATMAD